MAGSPAPLPIICKSLASKFTARVWMLCEILRSDACTTWLM
jgi:hypothetical protein